MAGITNPTEGVKNPIDEIASLLMGGEESAEVEEKQDSTDSQDETQSEENLNDDSTEDTDEDQESSTEESEEEVTWSSTLGLDDDKIVLDDKGNFVGLNVKVDGKSETLPLNDILAGYQNNKSNTQRSQALASEKKEFEVVRNETVKFYTQKLQEVTQFTSLLENKLMAEYKDVDWATLRQVNPGEYAAMVADFQARSAEVNQIKAAIATEQQQQTELMNTQQQKDYAEFLKVQAAKVIEKNPDWAKPDVFKKSFEDIKSFMSTEYGFTDEEIGQIVDARIFEVIKDAKAFKTGKKVADKKLANPVNKFQKTTSNGKQRTVSKLEQLTRAAKKEGNTTKRRKLETDAIAELLLTGGN